MTGDKLDNASRFSNVASGIRQDQAANERKAVSNGQQSPCIRRSCYRHVDNVLLMKMTILPSCYCSILSHFGGCTRCSSLRKVIIVIEIH